MIDWIGMYTRTQNQLRIFAAWCGVAYAICAFGGVGIVAKFLLPLHSPSASAETSAAYFQDNTTAVRIGMVILMLGALFAIPYSAVIAGVLRELDGTGRILSYSALLGGAGMMVLTFYPAIFWQIAAFRPERSPDLIQLMNDFGWLQLLGGVTIFLALPIAIAIAAFTDQSADPVFPRWAGYFNVWVIVLTVPNQLLFFFHEGPFAWDGIFGFWLPAFVFVAWLLVTAYLMLRSFRKAVTQSANVDRSVTIDDASAAQPLT